MGERRHRLGVRSASRVVILQSSRAAHHPRHHLRFAASLAAAGYDVLSVAQPDRTPGHRDLVELRYLPLRRNRLTRMLSGPLTVARALREHPDVLHVVCLDLLPWAVAARVLRPGLVVLYDSNEQYDLYVAVKEWLPPRTRPAVSRLVRRLEPRLAAQLDAVTVAVPATEAKFRAAGVEAVLVRNLPSRRLIEAAAEPPRFRHAVLVGGSLPDPQPRLVAETAARLRTILGRPVRWVVAVRHAGDRERSSLESALRSRGVRDDVTVLYDRPFEHIRRLARDAAAAFAPYPDDEHYRVALPIRLLEYMAWGMPFVTSELPAFQDLVGGAPVGLFERPLDPDAYAAALARVLSEPELGRSLGENGRRLVRTSLNWESEAVRLVGTYDALTGRGDPAPVRVAAT